MLIFLGLVVVISFSEDQGECFEDWKRYRCSESVNSVTEKCIVLKECLSGNGDFSSRLRGICLCLLSGLFLALRAKMREMGARIRDLAVKQLAEI